LRAAGAKFEVICRRWLGTLSRFDLTVEMALQS